MLALWPQNAEKGEGEMSNMSYCRFQNTLMVLHECVRALNDMGDYERELSGDELKACKQLIKLCKQIADDFEE